MPRHGKKSAKSAAAKEKAARDAERRERLLAKRKIEDAVKERQEMIRNVCKSAMYATDGKTVRNCLELAGAFANYTAGVASEPVKWSDRSDLLPAEDSDDKRVPEYADADSSESPDGEKKGEAGESKGADEEPSSGAGAGDGSSEAAVDPLMLRRDTIVEADGYAGVGPKSDAWMRDEDEDEYNSAVAESAELEVVHRHGGEGEGAASERERDWMLSLTKRNLMNLYIRARWGWSDGEKRAELTDPDARYLIVYRKGEAGKADAKRPLAFVHYRFIAQGAFPVLYLFEIQLERSARRRGVGKHLMRMVEVIAKRTGMGWVMLTVFNENVSARKLYMNKLGYRVDETSPSRVGKRGEHFQYEILSKCLLKHMRHVKMGRSIPLHVAAGEEEKARKRMADDIEKVRKQQEEQVLKALEQQKAGGAGAAGGGSSS